MKVLLFFDSNQIKSCALNKDNISQLAQNGIFCFTSMYVIDELASQKARKLIKDRNEVQRFVEEQKYKRFNVIFQDIDQKEPQKEFNDEKERLKELFGSNIIEFTNTPELNFKIIRNRNILKKPPFCDGESDKGWNDTLIWLDFCEYCKTSSYDAYYFVTADNGFHNSSSKQKLEDEFVSITKKTNSFTIKKFTSYQEIISYFKYDSNIPSNNTQKLSKESEINKDTPSKELIERCRVSIENLFYTLNSDDFGNEWDVPNVKITCTIGQEMAYRFYEILESKIDEYLIYDKIDLKAIFDEMNIECVSVYKTNKAYYDDFIQCMSEARENDRLFKSCISFLTTTINKMFVKVYSY